MIEIFGVKLFFSDYNTLLQKFNDKSIFTVACANQHYLNLAYEDLDYKNKLNDIDLVHPDGIGVCIAAFILSNNLFIPKRINGSDFYIRLLQNCDKEGEKIFLLGDSEDVLTKCRKEIENCFPNIIIQGTHHGYFDIEDESVIGIINALKPDLLFVGLGAPKQERWVYRWKKSINAKKIILVGGGLRVIGKDRYRGPKLIRILGLEWLARLALNPKKYWKRYLVGIPLFLYRILKSKFSNRVWA